MALIRCMQNIKKMLDMQQRFPGNELQISHFPAKRYCCYSRHIQQLQVPVLDVLRLHPSEHCMSLFSCNNPDLLG